MTPDPRRFDDAYDPDQHPDDRERPDWRDLEDGEADR